VDEVSKIQAAATVRTLDELVDVVHSIFSQTKRRWWFRGHADVDWELLPKVRRGYDLQTERYLTNLFYQRAKLRHASFPNDDDYASWLALMQHYGLPTRLLDWSDSALVAAYFATKFDSDMSAARDGRDAAIWMLQPATINDAQGYGPYFPSLNSRRISRLIDDAFKEAQKVVKDRPIFKLIAAVPVNQDMRMVMQQGAFTVHADSVPLEKRRGCAAWLRKIVIPSGDVPSMRTALDILGMRLSDVFPDLSHLAIDLMRMHPSRSFGRNRRRV
jgi:hypothetical protein